MPDHAWIEEFPGSIIVCDRQGRLLEMNARAARTYQAEGGKGLIGSSLLDCHPELARAKLAELLAAGQKNVYTVEKNGVKKLIFQSPWYADGEYAGLVELSLEIPEQMPHFVRG